MIGWIRLTTVPDTMHLGILWLVLTVLFEFGAGHYLFGNSWEQLLADHNLWRGPVWVVVPIVTLIAPMLAARLRGLVLSPLPSGWVRRAPEHRYGVDNLRAYRRVPVARP